MLCAFGFVLKGGRLTSHSTGLRYAQPVNSSVMLIRYGMNSGDNLEKIESSVELMEARLAKNMILFLNAGKYSIGKIQNDLEWFVTWRIKLVDLKNRMWCDGIDELRISKIGHNVVRVKAVASIGPESDVSLIF